MISTPQENCSSSVPVYKYDRVYLGVFIKSCNKKCGRAFSCVEIERPPEVVSCVRDDDKVEKKGDELFNVGNEGVEVKIEEEEDDVPVKKRREGRSR
ncbi:hypothetical protein Tco_1441211, partial [Tanacetum coccineum]